MRRAMPFAVPFLLVFFAGLVLVGPRGEDVPEGPPVRVAEIEALDPEAHPVVTVPGMAHYAATVRQETPATLFREAETHFLFPLFPAYETEDREIRVLVRTTRPPERFVSYELMVATGLLTRATPDKVPYDIEIRLGKHSDYFFSDDILLLEADEIGPYRAEEWGGDPAE